MTTVDIAALAAVSAAGALIVWWMAWTVRVASKRSERAANLALARMRQREFDLIHEVQIRFRVRAELLRRTRSAPEALVVDLGMRRSAR